MKKKIAFLIILLSMLLNTLSIFAADEYEVIPKEHPGIFHEGIKWTGKEFTEQVYDSKANVYYKLVSPNGFNYADSGLRDDIAAKDFLCWNGTAYVAFNKFGLIPDFTFDKNPNYSDSPMYILDENFKLIKTIEYPGLIAKYVMHNGLFYYITQKRVYHEKTIYTYYKTSDFETFEVEEGTYKDLERLLPVDNNVFEEPNVIYEDKHSTSMLGANYFHRGNKYSLDGIYFQNFPTKLPLNATYNLVWYIDGYLYAETETEYIKIKVERPDYVYIKLNGTVLAFEQPPVVEAGRTLVPMRFLFECLGDKVTWDEETRSVTAENKNSTVTFSLDSLTADVNGTEQTMDVPAKLIGDKTYVPLRFLSENLGYTVTWDEATNTAIVETK